MVQQRGNPLPQGTFYSSREWSRSDGNGIPPPEERFSTAAPPVHSRELSVEDALRDCARIPVKDFALIVLTESGDERIYLSRALMPYQPRIISDRFRQDFQRCARRAANGGQYASSSSIHRPHSRKQVRSDESDDDRSTSSSRDRKRPRYPQSRDRLDDEASSRVPVQKTQQLMIGDAAEVEKFYFCRFKDMQQSSCKVMGKAFVKLVEPKKQTHHPYTKGNDQAPPWWPPTEGEGSVRHREPDHLLKPERIKLLVWILRMIVEPQEKQHHTVQKLGLNVKKLEEVTMEQMSPWFSDKDHPSNEKKRPFLKEIFKIAKAEERYKNGEIDGTTIFPVMYGERAGLDASDEDDEDAYNEDEPAATTIPTPESLVSPSLAAHHPLQRSESDPMHRMQMPVRHGTQPMEEHSQYTDSYFPRSIGVGFQPQSPTMHDPVRRGFVSPVYNSPNPSLYHWQNGIVNNPPLSGNYYTTSPQSTVPPSTNYHQLPPPTTGPMLPPPIAPQHFDNLPPTNRSYGTASGTSNQLRTGSLGHPHHTSHGYNDYLHDPSPFSQSDQDMKDEHHLHQSQ